MGVNTEGSSTKAYFLTKGKYSSCTHFLALSLHLILVRVVFWHCLNHSNLDCNGKKYFVTFRIFLFVHIHKALFLYKYVRRTLHLSKITGDFFFLF